MAAVPHWFASEILQYLPGAIPGTEAGQYYARCPVPGHVDRHRSFAISPGKSIPVVFICQGGCSDGDIRAALIAAGASEEYLGPYGTPAYDARRMARTTSTDRARIAEMEQQIARLRWEVMELKASITGVMKTDLKLGLMKIRILAVMEGVDVPTDTEAAYVDFAERAGVPRPSGYRLWRTDPLVKARGQCVISNDHVVLAHPEDESQAPQVNEVAGIINPIEQGGPDYQSDYQSDNAATGEALEALRSAGMTNPAA